MRIGVFGGTFDPPHMGHLELSQIALESGLVDHVIFIPCLRHALGKIPAGFEHRLAMCKVLVENEPNMEVSDIESRLDTGGRTLDLLKALGQEFPDDNLRLLAGTDIYHERDRWYRFDEVARLAPPIYVERLGAAPVPHETLAAPRMVSSNEIRRAISEGRLPGEWIAKAVAAYIAQNHLYGYGT